MSMKATVLVGLDVHARQTHAAVLDLGSGELRERRLRVAPLAVAGFLAELGPGVRAVYEAGPTGFGLVRAAREQGITVEVVAPGGEYPAVAAGSCSAVNPAANNAPIQVTVRFNLVLITPVISQATANRIVIRAAAIFRTEY